MHGCEHVRHLIHTSVTRRARTCRYKTAAMDDEAHMDYKYFFATVPGGVRGQAALAPNIDPRMFALIVRADDQVTLDASLEGKTLVFLYRYAMGVRLVSAAVVREVLQPCQNQHDGDWETLVRLERLDGTTCELGLTMTAYWKPWLDTEFFLWACLE